MSHQKSAIVFGIRDCNFKMRKFGDAVEKAYPGDESLTRLHYWTIAFLYDRGAQLTCQRDIEAEFRISPSTTSTLIGLMEKKGLLTRKSIEGDARKKQLLLTDKAISLHNQHISRFHAMDEAIENAITPQEKEELLRILEKINHVIDTSIGSIPNETEE